MAWPDKLPNGEYRAGYRDSSGRKQYVKDDDGRTVRYRRKSDARNAAVEAEARANRKAAAKAKALPASTTWGQWWEYLSGKRKFIDTDTGSTEGYIVDKYLMPQWGDVPLKKISHARADEWVNEGDLQVRPGMSPGYVHRIFSVFHVSIKQALKEEVLEADPLAAIELPKRHKRPKPYLSVSTAKTWAEGEHLRQDYQDAIDFGLETALRPGELVAVHADRVDRERGWMLVAEVYVPRLGIIRPWPKDGDVRLVPLTPRALEIIDRRLDGRDLSRGCGVRHSDDSVCTSEIIFRTDRGRMMNQGTLGYQMRQASRKAKVPRRSPYAIRRGAATRMADGGLDAFALAEILGHATLTQAQEYVQQTPAARVKLTTALDQVDDGTLKLIRGGLGQGQDHGADDGAEAEKTSTDDDGRDNRKNAG